MDADFSVELGPDDETLEMPWTAGDNGPRYYDLKRHSEYLSSIKEVLSAPELGSFLTNLNASVSPFETAKCDTWSTTEMSPEEDIFSAAHKFGCYVDFLFSEEACRFSFSAYEQFAKDLLKLLQKAPEMPARAEFLIRRCFYHTNSKVRDGFYINLYVFGFGADESQARQRWAIALTLVENAIRQVSRSRP
jgi:hypothetical protein